MFYSGFQIFISAVSPCFTHLCKDRIYHT